MSKSVITLWYRPLELMLGAQNYGSYVDIWSCGIIYYEMLRSITPCQEKNRNEQTNSLIDKFDACRADFEAFDIPRKMLKKLKRMRTNVKKDIIHRILKIKVISNFLSMFNFSDRFTKLPLEDRVSLSYPRLVYILHNHLVDCITERFYHFMYYVAFVSDHYCEIECLTVKIENFDKFKIFLVKA